VIVLIMAGDRFTPGFAFKLAGIGILLISGAIEATFVLLPTLKAEATYGATDLVRLSAVPWGLGLLFIGYGLDHPEVLWAPRHRGRILATFLLFADGGLHILAIGEHVDSAVAALFILLAPLEFIGAFTIMRTPRPVLWAWLLLAVGLIALYAASRLVALPLVSQSYAVTPLGIISKSIEGLLVVALARELWMTSTYRLRRVALPTTQT
jgi:hypothetical protein